jgi:hypothetical protein
VIRLASLASLLALAAVSTPLARAQEGAPAATSPQPLPEAGVAPRPPSPARGIFGVGAQAGFFGGSGASLQLGTAAAGLRLAAGWAPIFLAYTEPSSTAGSNPALKLKAYSSLVVAPDLYLRLTAVRGVTAIGLQAGYRYSTVLGSGGAAGVYVQHPVGGKLDLLFAGGVLVFPDGETQLKEKKDLSNADFGFIGPNFSFGISAGILFFP